MQYVAQATQSSSLPSFELIAPPLTSTCVTLMESSTDVSWFYSQQTVHVIAAGMKATSAIDDRLHAHCYLDELAQNVIQIGVIQAA